MTRVGWPRFANTSDRQVVRLSTTGCENNFVRPSVDERSDLPAGFIDRGPGFLSKLVDARRISELAAQVRHHRIEDARVNRGGSAVIQINFTHQVFGVPPLGGINNRTDRLKSVLRTDRLKAVLRTDRLKATFRSLNNRVQS